MAEARERGGRSTTKLVVIIVIVVVALWVIGGTVIAIVGPMLWSASQGGELRESKARAQIQNLDAAIDLYRMTNKRLPERLEQLTQTDERRPDPFIPEIPSDPWGASYGYRVIDRSHYEIRSTGPDGEAGTEDDIVFTRGEGFGDR